MHIDLLWDRLQTLSSLPSPGSAAHDRIFPEIADYRRKALEQDAQPRLSAVAAIVIPTGDECSLLLIERQSYDGVHSAQVGFPGGKHEAEDADMETTARRETEEELGIPGESLQLIRPLSQVYIPPSRFLVYPFLFGLKYTPDLNINPREVNEALVMPVRHLLDDATLMEGDVLMQGGVKLRTRYFAHGERKIWGATAMMLSELKILLQQIS